MHHATKPNFFIVGAPKCGTTSMARYLGAHPDIFVAVGEPHYFGSDVAFNTPRLLESEYLELFSSAGNSRHIGDKSTWYLWSKEAAHEIRDFCPHASIIIHLRNPTEMLFSLHNHYVYHTGRETIRNFESALDAEEERRLGKNIPSTVRFPEQLYYSEIPLYAKQVKRYLEVFGRERVHIVVYDNMKKNPLAAYRSALHFLGVENLEFIPPMDIHNKGTPLKSVTLKKAIVSGAQMAAGIKRLVPTPLWSPIQRLRQKVDNWNVNTTAPILLEKTRRELQKKFQADVEELSKILNMDLTHWNK